MNGHNGRHNDKQIPSQSGPPPFKNFEKDRVKQTVVVLVYSPIVVISSSFSTRFRRLFYDSNSFTQKPIQAPFFLSFPIWVSNSVYHVTIVICFSFSLLQRGTKKTLKVVLLMRGLTFFLWNLPSKIIL